MVINKKLDMLPISEYQKCFFVEWALDPDSSAYNVSMVFKIEGDLDKVCLKKACEIFTKEHDVVHVHYNQDGSICYKSDFSIDDFYHEQNLKDNQNINIQIKNILNQPFDLVVGKLQHFYLLQDTKDSNTNYFIMVAHHIIADASYAEIINKEIAENYNCLKNNLKIPTNRTKSFIDAVHAEEEFLSTQNKKATKKFWQDYISDLPLSVDFPNNGKSRSQKAKTVIFELPDTDTVSLKNFARENKTTVFIVLSAIYGVILSKYSNQGKLLISYPINMRPRGYTNVTGCFVNNVPLRIDLDNHETLTDLIKDLTEQRKIIKEHQWYSLTDIIHDQKKIRNEFHNNYFNVGFIETNLNAEGIVLNGLNTSVVDVHANDDSMYLIDLQFDPRAEKLLKFKLEYMVEDIDESLVNSFIASFLRLTREATKDKILLKEYCVLSKTDYKKVIRTWNNTEKAYPENKTIHQLFEEQVEKTPNNIAIVYEDIKLTYQELNQRANQLANYLRETYKIVGDDLIGLLLDRSEYMLIGILGTLKSGAGYVPMDPSYPDERISYILEDTKAKVVLTNEISEDRLRDLIENLENRSNSKDKNNHNNGNNNSNNKSKNNNAINHTKAKGLMNNSLNEDSLVKELLSYDVLSIDATKTSQTLAKELSSNLKQIITSSNLAYVIYTSGTTGKPKGVMVEHKSLVLLSISTIYSRGLINKSSVCQTAPFVFDSSIAEIFPIIICGGKLFIVSDIKRKDLSVIFEYIREQKISHLFLTSKLGEIVLQDSSNYKVDNLILAGEKLQVENITSNIKRVINEYGPTETTVCAIQIKYSKLVDGKIIGKPIENKCVYILDQNQIPLPVGAIGELYIGGAGLARGYLNQPELTAEKFIANPFQTEEEKKQGKNGRLYKTGDLVRYLADGNIEYIGRNDFQVKIRGFRIELGELEAKLASYPGITQAVVLAKEHNRGYGDNGEETATNTNLSNNNNKYLVGYYVSDDVQDENEILNYLGSKLPEYMVPSVLVHLDKLPLTINGKLDRKALPDPEFTNKDSYVAPRDELEFKVCEVFAEVLGLEVDKVGIHDDFFRLGGDSIVSIQLVSRLKRRLDINISVKDIFTHKTVSKLYTTVISNRVLEESKLLSEQGILTKEVSLLPIQEWFWKKVDLGEFVNYWHWNQSFMIRVPELDVEILKESIIRLVTYHDSFRLSFVRESDGLYKQYYGNEVVIPELKLLDISKISSVKRGRLKDKGDVKACEESLKEILTGWQNDFELSSGQSYKFGYIDGYEDGSSRVFVSLHHLLVDAVSWRIITHDLEEIYNHVLLLKKDRRRDSSSFGKDNVVLDVKDNSIRVLKPELYLEDTVKLLGLKGTSYRQWNSILKSYKDKYPDEKSYWSGILYDYATTSKASLLKLVDKGGVTRNQDSFILDKEYTQLLLTKSNNTYNTQINDLLLSSLVLALCELTGSNIQHILLEGHGREEIGDKVSDRIDISRTVGWFTSMYPVRLELRNESNDLDIGSLIKRVKENLREVPNNGIGYGAINGYITEDLPQVVFNYLGQFDNSNTTEANDKKVSGWHIVGESSGTSMYDSTKNIININGGVVGGTLQFGIDSSLSQINTTKLSKVLEEKLKDIIRHTSECDREYLTKSDVGNIISEEYLEKLQKDKEISSVYLANSLQQGFIYHAINQGNVDDAYRVQLVFDYHNNLEAEYLKMAWELALEKYPSLRLRFAWEEELVQVIDKVGELVWDYRDISKESKDKRDGILEDLIVKDRLEPYALESGRLLRVYLIKQGKEHYSCILSNHHAILDGWSGHVLLSFVHEKYLELKAKEDSGLIRNSLNEEYVLNGDSRLEIDHSYEDAQRYYNATKNESKNFWNTYVGKIEDRADLSGLLKESQRSVKLNDYRHIQDSRESSIEIEGKVYEELKELTRSNGITINVVLQYVWHKILSVYGNSRTTVTGTTISGRNIPVAGVEESVGLYINTLPLIVEHRAGRVIELLEEIQRDINDINTHSSINLAELQKEGLRLFDSLFVYENYPISNQSSNFKLELRKAIEKLDYALGITAYESKNKITVNLKYAGELFNDEMIEDVLASYKNILIQIVRNPQIKVNELSYLSKRTYEKVIRTWNKTEKAYPEDKTIHQLFEEQVERTPDNIAIVYEDIKLTYRELNQRANQLANYLRENYKIVGDDLIGLLLDRSEYMLIGILGTLKSGAGYVPMDPSYPDERISYILEDTKAKVVLTNEIYEDRLRDLIESVENRSNSTDKNNHNNGNNNIKNNNAINHTKTKDLRNNALNEDLLVKELLSYDVLSIDNTETSQTLAKESSNNLKQVITSTNLAYVIYTSGTTGKPKGVMIEHKSVISLIFDLLKKYNIKNNERFILYANYVFDASVEQIYLALTFGNTLHVVDNKLVKEPIDFVEYAYSQEITHLHCTPSYLELLDQTKLNKLNRLICGAEFLPQNIINRFTNISKIYNEYGPTETTVTAMIGINSSCLSYKVANVAIYILDQNQVSLPVGAIGELYIGGTGLARGYLNQAELTREKFIANPFQTEEEKKQGKNGRLYKTGDLVRYLADGNIEYIGRNDFQVKIRGFRIELGEIEAKLASYPGITQAVVIAKEHNRGYGDNGDETATNTNLSNNNNKYLVAYYVSDVIQDENEILNYLGSKLPEYMVPSVLVHLDNLPLTINGKLDRKALPDPEFTNKDSYVAPRDELEFKVCAVFAEVLGLEVDKVGIHDDFFRIGGNSIVAIKLSHRLSNVLKINISVADVFRLVNVANIVESYTKSNSKKLDLVKSLTFNDNNRDNLVFIHPGGAGCEVYQRVADNLNQKYNSYGIDNYNIHNDNKINLLQDIAKEYLSQIIKIYDEKSQVVNLCGWSLGGQIALEMSYLLEQKGFTQINVILLDTVLRGKKDKIHRYSEADKDSFISAMYHNKIGYLKGDNKEFADYILKVKLAINSEEEIINCKLSGKLKLTNVILCRAINDKTTEILESSELASYAKYLKVYDFPTGHFEIIDYMLSNWKLFEKLFLEIT